MYILHNIGYFNTGYYARLANKVYDISNIVDPEVVLTVNAYNTDVNIASKQERLNAIDLQHALLEEYPLLNYEEMMQRVHVMLTELFRGVAPSIGYWPRSSAYYGVD